MAVCSIIKAELEPFLKDNLPSVASGMYFERLSFGLVPMSILGVRSVPSYNTDQHIAIGATKLFRQRACALKSKTGGLTSMMLPAVQSWT